ncbi:MAG: ASCH domain-containing protein [Sarcina sp.]
MSEKIINEFWEEFLLKTNRDKNAKYIESFHFELTEKSANELLRLVLIGKKKATASSFLGYKIEGQRVPQIGDLSIITDWEGNPKAVIETTNVMIIPFKEISFDICKREGEDDNLESWRKNHIRFFTNEGVKLGYRFTEEMPVVFEDFKVIFS